MLIFKKEKRNLKRKNPVITGLAFRARCEGDIGITIFMSNFFLKT